MLVIRSNFRHFLVTVKINYDLNITDLGNVPFPFLSGLLLTDTEQCKVDIVDNNLFCSRFIRSINVNIANIPPVKLVQCCSAAVATDAAVNSDQKRLWQLRIQ